MPTLDQIAGTITPIIDTFRAEALGSQRNEVRQRYEPNAERFFPSEAILRVRDSLLKRLSDGKRTLGYLMGDYGHGKTAAAIYLWQQCERQGICAVPPFQFTSFDDIVEAVIGWLTEALKDKCESLVPKAQALYNRYRNRSVEQHAEEMARRYSIALEVARRIVAGEIAERMSIGRAAHLADFLNEAARLAVEAGYRSLCVFADEMQIFIESGEVRDNIEDLRQLVLALRAEEAPLGLMLVIHERVGMVVQQNAGDAMQRMQDDGAGLNLGQYKEATFPRSLLEHLCKLAGENASDVTDEATMEALGQISVRSDLSNGPRTVAAAMRCIARHRLETGKSYRVWDLAKDYEQHNIVFDGVAKSLSGALAQLLSDDVVREDSRYGQVIKFLCVFPDGTPERFLKQYALVHALEELAQRRGLLGTVIYAPRSEHWALKALQTNPGSEDRITEIVRLFRDQWWYRQTAPGRISIARQAFAKLLLPELFPRRGQGDAGRKFSGHLAFGDPLDRDPGEVCLTGSFEATATRYPERRVTIAIGTDENGLIAYRPSAPDTHLALVFRLDTFGEPTQARIVTAKGDPRVDFVLNLDANVGGDYPPELKLLQDSIVPRQCTANVLLNLLFFLEDQVPRMALPESDRQQIREYLLRSARRVVEQMLFPSDGVEAVGVTVRGRGRQQIESVFEQKMAELFPEYRALQTGPEARVDLSRYAQLVKEGGLSLPVKRGQKPVSLSSREFLAKMGASAGSQFDAVTSRLKRLHLLALAKEESVAGTRHAEFTLLEHPLEVLLRSEIEASGVTVPVRRGGRDVPTKRILLDSLRRLALRRGYLETEFQTALDLATWRQWLEVDGEYALIAVPDDDPDALAREAEELHGRIARLASIDQRGVGDLSGRLDLLRRRLAGAQTDELSEISLEIRLLSERFRERIVACRHQLCVEQERLCGRIGDCLRGLPTAELTTTVTLPGSIGGVLESARKRLERRNSHVSSELEGLLALLAGEADPRSLGEGGLFDELVRHRKRLDSASESADELEKQASATRKALQALDSWNALGSCAAKLEDDIADRCPDLSRRLSDWMDTVVDAFRAAGTDGVEEVLHQHQEFRPALEALVAEFARMARSLRDEYDAFCCRLKDLFTASLLNAPRAIPFDSHNPDRSYQVVAEETALHLGQAMRRLQPDLADLAARATFLREFRNRNVTILEKRINGLRTTLDGVLSSIDPATVKAYRRGEGSLPSDCGVYASVTTERNEIAKELSALERADAPEGGLQEEILLAVRQQNSTGPTAAAHLFRDLRRQRTVTARELFEALEQLYMQGNIEILVRERSPGD
jgi:hypothetical protein